MALRAAYEDLQLDPDDHAQVAAFSKFCWQHILEHMTTRRVVEFRDGTVLLQWQKRSKISELSCTVFHYAIDDTVSGFVNVYAEVLWPADNGRREHLATANRPGPRKELHATPANLSMTHEKEAELSECNVITTCRTNMAESMIGCRVRSYLTALLLSDEEIPASQPMNVSELFQKFLRLPKMPAHPNKKRDYSADNESAAAIKEESESSPAHKRHCVDDESAAVIKKESEPSPAHKRHCTNNKSPAAIKEEAEPSPTHERHRVGDIDTPASCNSQERSGGYVRLRFTYCGARRLQHMLSCPSRPTSATSEGTRATERPENLNGSHSNNESLHPQDSTSAVVNCRCWVWSCDEEFKTIADVVEHVQTMHAPIYWVRVRTASPSLVAEPDEKRS
jgi:hypothetical protein